MQSKLNKIPVVFVIMQTGNQANGGIESITAIVEKLQDVAPIIITQLETPVNERWSNANAEVYIWEIPYNVGSSFKHSSWRIKWLRVESWVKTNYQMYGLLQRTSAQIVHCNDGWGLWHTVFGARLARAKVIYNIRDTKPPDQQYGWHWQIFIRLAHHILVLSKDMKEKLRNRISYLQRHPIKTSYIYSIVNFTDTVSNSSLAQDTLRNVPDIAENEIRLGIVAMFNYKKAQLDFIRYAAPYLSHSDKQIKVFFLGDFDPVGNEYARLCQQEVEQLGLENIIEFVGFTPNIEEWYRIIDIVVVASRYEGLARCMIESISCGTPVVSFDVTSAREILEDYQCGIVVPQGNYKELLSAILYLVENPHVRMKLGVNGQKIATALFEYQKVIPQYETLYLSLLK